MERATRIYIWVSGGGMLLGTLLGLSSAQAGTVLLPSSLHQEDHEFPESRFGQPPAPAAGSRVQRSPASGLAKRETMAEEAEREDNGKATPFAQNDGIMDQVRSGRSIASVAGSETSRGLSQAQLSEIEMQSVTRRKGVQEIAVIAGDLGFFPRTFFVSRDVPVRLFVTGASKSTLCIMMDSFQVRKQVRSQKIEEITFTPSNPGKYRFYCPVNGMEGTMIVKEFANIPAPADTAQATEPEPSSPVAANGLH